jgi:PTS system mannose-specific IIA component
MALRGGSCRIEAEHGVLRISLEHCAALHKNAPSAGSRPSVGAAAAREDDGTLMIGMVLVTHGQLATGFRAALEHVVGPQSRFETITIGPEDDMEQRRADILGAVARVQDGSGVVLLTDMFGGTPSNLAISVMDGGRVEVICGINLPMLIKLTTLRDSADLDHAVMEARDAGRKYITVASKVLAGK